MAYPKNKEGRKIAFPLLDAKIPYTDISKAIYGHPNNTKSIWRWAEERRRSRAGDKTTIDNS